MSQTPASRLAPLTLPDSLLGDSAVRAARAPCGAQSSPSEEDDVCELTDSQLAAEQASVAGSVQSSVRGTQSEALTSTSGPPFLTYDRGGTPGGLGR